MSNTNNSCCVKLKECKNLVLSSGGSLGIAYLGLHKIFEECYDISNIETILGVSAGSIYGMLMIIGYSYEEIYDILCHLNFNELLNVNIDSILNLKDKKGLDSMDKIMDKIKELISRKIDNINITFKELYEKFNKSLLIGVTNITFYRFEVFGFNNYPDLPIIEAIKISCCIPLIFEPIIFNNNVYVDGGLFNPYPIDFFDKDTLKINNINYNIQKYYVTYNYKYYDNNIKNKENNKENSKSIQVNNDKNDKVEIKNTRLDIDINTETYTNTETDINTETDNNTEINTNTETDIISKDISFNENINPLDFTFGICLSNVRDYIYPDYIKTIDFFKYFNVIFILSRSQTILNINKYKKNTCLLELPVELITGFSLDINEDDIENIFKICYNEIKKSLKI